MKELAPVRTVDLFPVERQELLTLLEQLSADDWERPTICDGWSVKDLAAHVLGDDLGVLSRRRDGQSTAFIEVDTWDALVAELNVWNEQWVAASRRLSPRLLIELLTITGNDLFHYLKSLDPNAMGGPVNWAGPEAAPVWMDTAREYTEHWLHQQQMRDALKQPGLLGPELYGPVLATFVRALPQTYRDVEAEDGTHVTLVVTGDAGGEWSLVKQEGGWALGSGEAGAPDATAPAVATATVDERLAWRLFTKGLTDEQARDAVRIEGDRALGEHVLRAVAIIA